MQLAIKKQHEGINREHCCVDLDKVQREKRASYVVKISACSVNVPATVNRKAILPPLLIPCINSFWDSHGAQW